MSNLARETTLYTIGNLLPKVGLFFLLPFYTSVLSTSEFGIVESLSSFRQVLVILLPLSLHRSIPRFFFEYQNNQEKQILLGTIFISTTIIGALILLISFMLPGLWGGIFKSISFYPYFALFLITIYLINFGEIPKNYYRLTHQPSKFVIIAIIEFILIQSGIVIFILYQRNGAISYFTGRLFGSAIFSFILIFISLKIIKLRFDFKKFKPIFLYSLPLIPGSLAGWGLTMSNRVFIERYFSMEEVGIFSLSFRIASVVLLLVGAFRLAYEPIFFEISNSKSLNFSEKINQLKNYNSFTVFAFLLLFFTIALFSKEVIIWFFPDKFYESYKLIPLLCLAYSIAQISGLFDLAMKQVKKTKYIMMNTIIGAGVSIGLNFLLIPIWGIYGAAIALIISFLTVMILLYFETKRFFYIPFLKANHFLVYFGFVTIVYVFNYYLALEVWLGFAIKLLLVGLIFLMFYLKNKNRIQNILIKEKT